MKQYYGENQGDMGYGQEMGYQNGYGQEMGYQNGYGQEMGYQMGYEQQMDAGNLEENGNVKVKNKKKKKKKEKVEYQYINSLLNNSVLDYKVYVLGITEKILVNFIIFVIGGLVGLVFFGGLFKSEGEVTVATIISNIVFFCSMGTVAKKFFMPMYKNRQLKKRQEKLRLQFKDMLESLATSFSTGSNMLNAFDSALKDLKMQYQDDDYIILELEEIIGAIKSNIKVETALKFFGERSGLEDIDTFADIFGICYKKGGDMKRVARQTYDVISDKMSINDEIETKLTSNKLQHNAMSIMPIIVVGMLRITNADFAESFASIKGVLVNIIAIALFLLAYRYGNKIIDIKE